MTNHTNLQKKTREPIFQLDVTLVNSYCDNFVRLFWKNVKREWLIKLFSEASEVSLWKRAERHECSANDSWEIKYLSSGFEQAIGWHDGMGNEFDTEQGSWHLHSLQRIWLLFFLLKASKSLSSGDILLTQRSTSEETPTEISSS